MGLFHFTLKMKFKKEITNHKVIFIKLINLQKGSIVVFRQMEKHNELFGSLPSFNGYGSREEIEEEYELLVPQEKLQNYSDWDEIFDMIEKSR